MENNLGILKFNGERTLKGENFLAERIEVEGKFKAWAKDMSKKEKKQVLKDWTDNKNKYWAKLKVFGNLMAEAIRIDTLLVTGNLNCGYMDLINCYVKGDFSSSYIEDSSKIWVGKNACLTNATGKNLIVKGNCSLSDSCNFENVFVYGDLEILNNSIISSKLFCAGTLYYCEDENLPPNQYVKKKIQM